MTSPDELEKLARAATPGPWTWDDPLSCASGLSGPSGTPVIEDLGYDGLWIGPDSPNAAFIAAANPATILDLLAANRKMRAALERIADPRNIHFAGDAQVVARSALSTKEQPDV
jgi:hypothetical protein